VELGAFSVSLAVKDLQRSKVFYEKFGFKVFAGDAAENWLILKNGDHTIGLFQGMFEKNILTFNPGWDQNAQKLDTFTDVRDRRHGVYPAHPPQHQRSEPIKDTRELERRINQQQGQRRYLSAAGTTVNRAVAR